MMFPFFIPYNSEETKCPNCGKKENKKEVCKHCGYDYPEGNDVGTATIFFVFFLIVSVLNFFFNTGNNPFSGRTFGEFDLFMFLIGSIILSLLAGLAIGIIAIVLLDIIKLTEKK